VVEFQKYPMSDFRSPMCDILMVYSNFCTTRTGLTVTKEKPLCYNTETRTGFSLLMLAKEINAPGKSGIEIGE
jgi:hypothetical protein